MNDTIYVSMQPSIIESERYKDGGYYFKCKKEDAHLLLPDYRTFSFPKMIILDKRMYGMQILKNQKM